MFGREQECGLGELKRTDIAEHRLTGDDSINLFYATKVQLILFFTPNYTLN